MTADERLEALLNRAGQTISDLPENYGDSAETLSPAFDAAYAWFDAHCLTWTGETAQYILHLTDVIDRMEWALDKTIRERAYLARRLGDADCDCDICVYSDVNEAEMPCYQCDFPEKHFEFAGIPEDWRADDD